MAIIKDNKRNQWYISYKAKTADGWKTFNIRNSDWKTIGDLKVTSRWMKSVEESEIEKDKRRRGLGRPDANGSLPTVKETVDAFLSSLKVEGMRQGTIYRYGLEMRNYVLKPLGEDSRACDAFTVKGMDSIKKGMSEAGLCAETMNGKLASVRNLMKFAKTRKYLPREQADDCLDALTSVHDDGSKARKEPNFFSNGDDDVKAFFDTFKEDDADWLVPMQVLFYGAFRIGEFLGITEDCVLKEMDGIRICKQVLANGKLEHSTKTGSDRVVRLPHAIMESLAAYMESHCVSQGGFVFSMGKRKPLSRTSVRRVVDRHLDMAGLRHITLHGLRHSMATRMFDRGYDVREVQEQLGHSSMETTMKFYIHYTDSKRKKDLDDLL